MKKLIEQFNKLNDQTRYAVVVMVIFVVILLDVMLLLLPQINDISTVSDKVKQLSDDTVQVRTDRQRLGVLRKTLKNEQEKSALLNSKMRTAPEVPAILSTISSIAKDNGVKIDELVPNYGQIQSLQKSPDGNSNALPIAIKARCGYHMFGHFLNKLEDQNFYFILKDFIIQNEDNNGKIHLFSLTMDLILAEQGTSGSNKP